LPDPAEIAAIVLAAGASSRFGADKLLHPVTRFGVTLPLAAHSLLPWLKALGPVTVIVRPESQAFCRAIENALGSTYTARFNWFVCADAAQGMAHSIACGVQENRDASGWLIGLADMPAVPSSAITGVRNALLSGANIAASFNAGKRGHPVGFSANYRNELLALSGDTGARRLIERDNSKLVHVEVDDVGIFADIDTPADLQLL
jgi:molybdenum cofactor cytidylyltransferase